MTMEYRSAERGAGFRVERRAVSLSEESDGDAEEVAALPTTESASTFTPAPIMYYSRKETWRGLEYTAKYLVPCSVIVNVGNGWRKMKCAICGSDTSNKGAYLGVVKVMLDHYQRAQPKVFPFFGQSSLILILNAYTSTQISKQDVRDIQAGKRRVEKVYRGQWTCTAQVLGALKYTYYLSPTPI
jgi:uncharacterized protein YcgL (UPF0745 family)